MSVPLNSNWSVHQDWSLLFNKMHPDDVRWNEIRVTYYYGILFPLLKRLFSYDTINGSTPDLCCGLVFAILRFCSTAAAVGRFFKFAVAVFAVLRFSKSAACGFS